MLFFLIIASVILVFHSVNKTYAAAAVNLSAIPPDIQSTLQAFDTPNTNPSTPYNTCNGNQGSGQIPYEGAEFPWISTTAGSQYDGPLFNPIKVPYGTQNINLVMNNLTFICHLATVGDVSFPGNAAVNAASCADTLPYPSLPPNKTSEACVSSIYISSATASIPGNLSCITGQQSAIWYQNDTKFWFENPTQPGNSPAPGCSMNPEGSFSFTSASPITHNETLSITVNEIEVSQFYIGGSAVYMCVVGNYRAPNQTVNAASSGCNPLSKTIYLSLSTAPTVPNVCPPWNGTANNNGTQVPVNTPNQVPAGSAPSQSYGSSGSQYVTNSPSGYTLNSIIASPSNDSVTPFNPSYSTSGNFTADYAKVFKDYPYDSQTVTANYSETFKQTLYIANGPAVYGPAPCELPYTYNGVPGCSQYGPAPVLGYTFTSSTGTVTQNFSSAQTPIPECYNRHFSITATSNTPQFLDSSGNPTVENPATVQYKPSTTVTFSANHGGSLISPYLVNGINTTINGWYSNTAASSTYNSYPYACSSTPSLPINYSNSSISPQPSASTPYNITYSCPATIPSLSYGDVACFNIGIDKTSGTMNSNGAIQTTSLGQIYAPGPGSGPPPITNVSCTQPLQAKPYIKVFGGDVLAGLSSQHIASCYNNPALILGFNKGSTGQQGSGTTVADLATGSITGFVSGQNILNMLDPLTFANTQSPPSYGGSYGTVGSCGSGKDYYQYAQELTTNPPPGFSVQPAPSTIGTTKISAGTHKVYYATGDIAITGNITYNTAGSTASNMPSFELVVKGGNITIGNNVTELDGVYIDEGGTITDHGTAVNECTANYSTDYKDICSQPLIIKGSLVAKQIDLYRSYGTYHLSSPSPNPSDPYASEQFIYSPLTWLTPGYSKSPIVQSVTSLPPIVN